MPQSPREELLKLQKKIFRRNQGLIEESISIREKGFEKYQKTYEKYVRTFERESSIDELQEAILKADIIYVGDYHTNQQSQRTFLRLLKLILPKNSNILVAMELVHARYQKIIDAYLSQKISEEVFLKKMDLKKRWYFDLWKNFQPIFQYARYHQIPIIAVEAAASYGSTLKERDQKCAQKIVQCIEKNPRQKIFVLIGDLHIAPDHLPYEVKKLLQEKRIKKNELLLYQNSAAIYWKLAECRMEERAEIVKLPSKKIPSYCMINTPPILWQQSYLNWLEHEEGEFDFSDAKHSFLELVDQISEFLEIKLSSEKEEVEVYTCGDLSFLERLGLESDIGKPELLMIKKQIVASESYYFAKKKIAYLGSVSLHHVAEEATHYIKHLCAGDEFPRDPADAFYANVLHEALGFFGSKIINHHRKCSHEKDFESLLLYFRNSGKKVPKDRILEREIAMDVLALKKMEKKKQLISNAQVMQQNITLFFGVTHALGYMLGDRLYYGLLSHAVKKSEIRDLFFDAFQKEGEPGEVYLRLLKRLSKVKLPKRV